MYLSTIYLNSGIGQKKIMKNVARIQAEGRGYWFINLFGEKKFIEGSIETVDLMEGRFVLVNKEESNGSLPDSTVYLRQD
jgi:predicted RNA-binding protein